MKPCMSDPLAQDADETMRTVRCRGCDMLGCLVRRRGDVPVAQPPSALDTQVAGDHYRTMAIQPVEFITRNGLGFLEGNVIKRVCRYRSKAGAQDLRKAIHELQLMLELHYPGDTQP